jgi:hypothetical protein
MGARGPHDDFDTAKNVIAAAYADFNLNQDIGAVREHISDEVEYVTRYGTFHGPERFVDEIDSQTDRWKLQTDIEEFIDAGEGAVIILTKLSRIDPESGEVEWKAWPAAVLRILDRKLVFFEAYVDRRRALADYGVARD